MNASDLEPAQVRAVVEAVLITADQPVTPGRLLALLKGLNGKGLREAVDDLNERYNAGGHAMSVVEVAGGFQLTTHKELGPWVRKFHDRGRVRLTQAGLETLSIIAFKQPVTRAEIDSIRGVDSSGVIRTLFEVNMVRVVGRSEGIGKPMLFGTTREFMMHFGLRSLADLPKPKELKELLAEGERQYDAAPAADGEGGQSDDTAPGGDDAADGAADTVELDADAGESFGEESSVVTSEEAADLAAQRPPSGNGEELEEDDGEVEEEEEPGSVESG